MKAKISHNGFLTITAETETEEYALSNWLNNSATAIPHKDMMEVNAGTFSIENMKGVDLIDDLYDGGEEI